MRVRCNTIETLGIPTTALTPIINSENWLLNKTPQEIERLAEEAVKISPFYETTKRKGYQNYKFPANYKTKRGLSYKLEYKTIKLPILVNKKE